VPGVENLGGRTAVFLRGHVKGFRLVQDWLTWNASMLPEIDESLTDTFSGAQLADHIGLPAASGKADNPPKPPSPKVDPRCR
jgi:hypothetical protein